MRRAVQATWSPSRAWPKKGSDSGDVLEAVVARGALELEEAGAGGIVELDADAAALGAAPLVEGKDEDRGPGREAHEHGDQTPDAWCHPLTPAKEKYIPGPGNRALFWE
jgi:hypothetical protein